MSANPQDCECGRPGAHQLSNRDWACSTCWAIDSRRAITERRQKLAALSTVSLRRQRTGWKPSGLPEYPFPKLP